MDDNDIRGLHGDALRGAFLMTVVEFRTDTVGKDAMRDIVRMPFSGYRLSLVGTSPTFRQGMHACLDELDTVVTKGKARTFGRGVRQEWASLVLDLTGKVFIPGVSGIA